MEATNLSNKQTTNREREIDLAELFGELLHYAWLIALATVLAAAVLFVVTRYCETPLYQSSVSFYVNNGQRTEDKISNADITASQSLVDTYIVILREGTTLDEVSAKTDIPYTPKELSKKISCAAINDTEVFKVTVTDPSPEMAAKIARAIADILPNRVSEVIEGSTVSIVRPAEVPKEPSSPNLMKNMLLGAIFGFFISALYVALRYILDDRIRDAARTLKENYPYPVLAVIPDLMTNSGGYYYYSKRKEESK